MVFGCALRSECDKRAHGEGGVRNPEKKEGVLFERPHCRKKLFDDFDHRNFAESHAF